MKKIIIINLLSFLFIQAYNQSPLISVAHAEYEIAAKLIEQDTTILLIGKYDSLGEQYLFFNEYTIGGVFINSTTLVNPFEESFFSITEVIADSLSNFYCIGTIYSDTTFDLQIGVVKFDNFYNFTDAYNLGQLGVSEAVYDAMINSKGNIIVGGYSLNTDEAFLYEYDSEGGIINEVVYSEDSTWLGVLGIVEDTTNNRYISSQTKFSLSVIDNETLEITSENAGQIIDSSYLIRYLYSLPNTNDFLASYVQYSSFETDYTNYYISRLTPEFDTLWTMNFGNPISDVLFFPNALTVMDSDNIWLAYVSCNNCSNYLYEEISHSIIIKKFNTSGNLIGEYYINGEYNFGYLSASATSDFGVYIISSLYNWNLPANDLDIIVFKLDSSGNLITGNDNIDIICNTINVFPNPATEYLHFHSEIFHNDLQIEIYRIDGSKQIDQSYISKDSNVDISHLLAGIYIYRILDNGNCVQSGKFIKK